MKERFFAYSDCGRAWRVCDRQHGRRFIWNDNDGQTPIRYEDEDTARDVADRLNELQSDAQTPWLD